MRAILLVSLSLVLAGCASDPQDATPTPTPTDADPTPEPTPTTNATPPANATPTPATNTTPTTNATPTPEPTPQTVEVKMASVAIRGIALGYAPDALTIETNTSVTWTNEDPALPHTATADEGAFDSGSLAPGATFSFVFTEPGTYEYHCSFHPSMRATVVVT